MNGNESNREETKKYLASKKISCRPSEFIYALHRLVKVHNKKLCGMQTSMSRERDAKMPREKRTQSTYARLPTWQRFPGGIERGRTVRGAVPRQEDRNDRRETRESATKCKWKYAKLTTMTKLLASWPAILTKMSVGFPRDCLWKLQPVFGSTA